MRRRPLAVVVATFVLVGSIHQGAPVRALWLLSTPADGTSTALTLAAPGTPTATGVCALLVAGPAVRLDWTPTQSSFASGYDVLRSNSATGPFTVIATVPGPSTITHTDFGLLRSTTYHYRLRSRVGEWSSTATATGSATTPTLCL